MRGLARNLGQPCPKGASPEAGPEAGSGFRSAELSPRSRLRVQKQAQGSEAGSEAGPEAGSRRRLRVQKQAQGFGPLRLHSGSGAGPEAGLGFRSRPRSRLRVLDCPEAGSGFRSKPRSRPRSRLQLPGSEGQNSAQEHDRDLGEEQPRSSKRLPEARNSLPEVILFMMAGFWMPNKLHVPAGFAK